MNLHRTILLIIACAHTGCTGYGLNVLTYRDQLESGNYAGAARNLSAVTRNPDRLLFLMESGLVAHYDGDYARSNGYFAEAERVSDWLYTRSATQELKALLTNDQMRPYRGEPFERVLIHYYRALNYWYSGLREDALVECRKANRKLAAHVADAETEPTYRNDAFIHYVTGLFYEAEGEWNDAWVSYRNARRAYGTYHTELGVSFPDALDDDLDGTASYLDENARQRSYNPRRVGELVLFAEVGFVPYKTQKEWNLPLYDTDIEMARGGDVSVAVKRVAGRWRKRRHTASVDYWLRVAMPELRPSSDRVQFVNISSGATSSETRVAEDIGAIAKLTFRDNLPRIQTRSIARALAKYAVSEGIEKKNRFLGFLANLFTASVEAADTRSWVSLPDRIFVGRLELPPGTHRITVETVDASGRTISRRILEDVQIAPGRRTFRNVRLYS